MRTTVDQLIEEDYLQYCLGIGATLLEIAGSGSSDFTAVQRAWVCSGLGSSVLRGYKSVAGPDPRRSQNRRERKTLLAQMSAQSLKQTDAASHPASAIGSGTLAGSAAMKP